MVWWCDSAVPPNHLAAKSSKRSNGSCQ
ncbi:hypothetical protein E2C01_056017 [Portunus trituberculatus]|uniref:Uncharacterized protein n=1 Tax=Portunus trituberculatus TaxID=210409 RepID=A0A5B7GP92_PORTR|nr:hypothetical protein [Portunus trituberculatus]